MLLCQFHVVRTQSSLFVEFTAVEGGLFLKQYLMSDPQSRSDLEKKSIKILPTLLLYLHVPGKKHKKTLRPLSNVVLL